MVNKQQKYFSLVLFSLARGGAEKAAITIANELIKNNDYNVRVVTLDQNTHLIKELSSKIKYIRLFTIKKYPLLLYISSIFSLFIFMLFQRKHTILAFAEWPSIVVPTSNFFLLRKHNVIISEQNKKTFLNDPEHYGLPIYFKIFARFSYSIANSIICSSQGITEFLPDSLRNKTTTIYNPFPITKILKLSSEKCSPYTKKNTVKLLSIGRFVPQKNYPNLIKAMRILKEDYNFPFELIIIGTGPKEEEIKQLISDFSLNDSIHLYPETNNPYKFISQSDIFVLASDFEGFGNVIVEALICNKKVVSTNCPSGPSEILKNGKFGFLCDINSPNDLANTIYKANNSNLPQGIENRVKDFSIKNIFRDYQKVICDK